VSALRTNVCEGLAAWARAHGWQVHKLTANRRLGFGVQVVALDKSDYAPAYYLRYGIWLGEPDKLVLEPECDLRLPVKGPWESQPAFTEQAPLAPIDVTAVLDRHVAPLVEATESRHALDKLYRRGDLDDALILLTAKKRLGWA
jgi:hypothetical protein